MTNLGSYKMQRVRAMDKVRLPPAGRAFRIFCSE